MHVHCRYQVCYGPHVLSCLSHFAGTETTLQVDPCDYMCIYQDLKDVASEGPWTYCMRSRSDQEAIDSIQQPNRLFQMTVDDHHSINAAGLSNALEQLRKDSKTDAELFFAVPPDQYPRCVRTRAPVVLVVLHSMG